MFYGLKFELFYYSITAAQEQCKSQTFKEPIQATQVEHIIQKVGFIRYFQRKRANDFKIL